MSTILIVDDEKNIRTSLATTFELEGYQVLTAADGLRALDAVEGGGIDLVLLDLQMPELDGLGVLRRLREAGHDFPISADMPGDAVVALLHDRKRQCDQLLRFPGKGPLCHATMVKGNQPVDESRVFSGDFA